MNHRELLVITYCRTSRQFSIFAGLWTPEKVYRIRPFHSIFELYVGKSKAAATDVLSFTKILGFEYVIAECKGRTLTTFQKNLSEILVFFMSKSSLE